MTQDLTLSLALFAFATSITPGPNNLMLMTSGVHFGFRRSVPHMLGIGVGFVVMLAVVGFGLRHVIAALPGMEAGLRAAAFGFVLWLAWRLVRTSGTGSANAGLRPLGFWQAAAFQWVNPKGWAMALSALSLYAPDHSPEAVLAVALIFGAINLPSVSTWTLLGLQLRRCLTSPRRQRAFNLAMAGLLVASMAPVFLA